ncbi:MAG: glycosyltransferase [Aphanocapsa sp. GSE-SYN-MK-11-07L]|jgi:rhamnosyl/mannosyltransferase|nr:glycosyltransferase [Aphanocapsa sp. GSE-SYN-MK-11-07L]
MKGIVTSSYQEFNAGSKQLGSISTNTATRPTRSDSWMRAEKLRVRRPDRIYHFAKYYPPTPGGIETHVQTLARAQAALGAEVHVICINGSTHSTTSLAKTATVEEMDGDVRVTRIGRDFTLARFDVCPELFRTLRQLQGAPDTIFHLHTPNPTMLMALMTLRPTVPLVVTHHSDIVKQRFLKYALRPVEHCVYRRATRIVTTSDHYIAGSKFLKLYEDNLASLPLGLDSSAFGQPSSAALAFANSLRQTYNEPIWLTVGRLVYYKALQVGIAALVNVPGKLYVIGNGPLEQDLKRQAQALGLSDRIIWHGQASQDELVGAYHAATALWFPSNARSEGFGLVQVEAMASGCPVINAAIPCSGVTWVSRHEQEALTIPLNDPIALAQAAWRLLNEPGLRDRLAEAGRIRAQEFDHITMAKRSMAIYEQIL